MTKRKQQFAFTAHSATTSNKQTTATQGTRESPSNEDYSNFHGMLCSPKTAASCIDSFDGISMIIPNTYSLQSSPLLLAKYDVTPPVLTMFSYYLLVLISLTGLSTLCKSTKLRCAEEHLNQPVVSSIASISDKELVADDNVWGYVKELAEVDDLRLQRRFEFEFLGGLLTVVMLHLKCSQDRLHLVEVYSIKNKLLHGFAGFIFDAKYALRELVSETAHFVIEK
jgi:hypothetical protein